MENIQNIWNKEKNREKMTSFSRSIKLCNLNAMVDWRHYFGDIWDFNFPLQGTKNEGDSLSQLSIIAIIIVDDYLPQLIFRW